MKRSAYIDANFSDYTQAEFFNFLFILIYHKPFGKPVISMFYSIHEKAVSQYL